MLGSSVFFNALTPDQKEDVLKQYAKEANQRFWWYVDAMKEGLGLETVRGTKKLDLYRKRLPASWDGLRELNEGLYTKQMREWQTLESNEVRKRSNPVPHTPQSIADIHIPGIDT